MTKVHVLSACRYKPEDYFVQMLARFATSSGAQTFQLDTGPHNFKLEYIKNINDSSFVVILDQPSVDDPQGSSNFLGYIQALRQRLGKQKVIWVPEDYHNLRSDRNVVKLKQMEVIPFVDTYPATHDDVPSLIRSMLCGESW